MKRVLITGVNSYVGNSLEKWLEKYPEKYRVDKISLRDGNWHSKDFSIYDVVVHVAGIAHVSTDPKMEEQYYKVNRDLTIDVAKKAKNEGVKQFIFLSSIIVYGDSINNTGYIDKNTIPRPSNFYGKSKLQAEEGIRPLGDENFKVVILRPPMIYGKGSKGNYPKLSRAAQILPIFPDIDNERSMLHIDNLSEFLRLIVDNEDSGLFFPQNKEYVKTSEMVRCIAAAHGKKIRLVKWFNPILRLMSGKIAIVDKVFGNLVYDQGSSLYKSDYQIRSLNESIMHTEIENENKNKNIDLLIVSDNCLETIGGEQESTKIIIQGMHNYLNIGVIQPGPIKNKVPGVKYYHLTTETRIKHLIKNPVSFFRYILNVRKNINAAKPKMVHTQSQVSFFIVALLKKLKLIPKNISFLHTERGLYTKYSNFFKKIFLFFMKELDTLVTTTEFNLKHWKKALTEKKISVNYKVIENTAGELFETFDEKLKKRDKSTLTIGFAGRYTDWKNWPLAVEISEKLNDKIGDELNVKMAVGCLDEKAEKETKEMFSRLKKTLGDRFEGMINISLEEMDKFYYDIDVFVLTSKRDSESFGRTLVEAMSRKTAVLTTNSGGSVEVVGDKNNVFNTAEEFVDRILEFYNNRDLLNFEKEKNYLRVKEKYSTQNNIEKHISLYTDLLKDS